MKKWGRLLLVLFSIIIISEASEALAQLPDVCQEPENILANCNFDNGMEHWQTFIETGQADFTVLYGGGECHAPLCPAAHIVTNDHFVGGLYQQVPVTPGNTYYANIIWLVFDSFANDPAVNGAVGGIGRRIGIDPFGGTDSRAPEVVWSQDNWRNDCKICGVEEVSVTAQADQITVFLRIDDTWRLRAAEKGFPVPPSKDQFWLDDIGLKQIGEGEGPAGQPGLEPTEPPPPPTEPPPPTATTETESLTQTTALTGAADEPAQAGVMAADLPAETEETSETEATEEIAEAETETEEAGPTPETPPAGPVKTAAPPPTLTPTNTPPATATPVAQAATGSTAAPARGAAAPQPLASPVSARQAAAAPLLPYSIPSASAMELVGLVGTIGCLGGAFALIMGLVFLAATWLYRLGWGEINDEAEREDDFDDDDIALVEAEIVE